MPWCIRINILHEGDDDDDDDDDGDDLFGLSSFYNFLGYLPVTTLTSWTGQETQWNSNDLRVARVLQVTPRLCLLLLLPVTTVSSRYSLPILYI